MDFQFERDNAGRFKKGMKHPLKSEEEIQQVSDSMHGKKYRYLARKSSDSKTGLFECLQHGTVFEQLIASHLRGATPKTCHQCYHNKLSDTQKKFQREWIGNRKKHPRYRSDDKIKLISNQKFLGRYKFLGRDKDYRYGIFECSHGAKLRQVLYQHTKGVHPIGCIKCLHETRTFPSRTEEEIREIGCSVFEGTVYFLKRCANKKQFGEFICREHGIKFNQNISSYIKGVRGCVLCRRESSQLHNKFYKILKENFSDEDIQTEKRYPDCKNIHELKFDFFIKSLNFLIECDGSQHFISTEYWGGEEGLKIRLGNDKIKDDYTKKNKINFMRVAFFEKDRMREMLDKALVQIHSGQQVYIIHENKLHN